jgi:hypothetical protein
MSPGSYRKSGTQTEALLSDGPLGGGASPGVAQPYLHLPNFTIPAATRDKIVVEYWVSLNPETRNSCAMPGSIHLPILMRSAAVDELNLDPRLSHNPHPRPGRINDFPT